MAMPKPRKFDNNIIVIGAGAGGLVAAYIAAAVKAKVTLIEKQQMGGDCLYTGCVPSKAFIRSAKLLAQAKKAKAYGFKKIEVTFDFAEVMARIQRIIKTIEPHDSAARYTALGVDCITGEAKITSPWTVAVNGRTISTRNIIIASGAGPFIPPIDGIENIRYLTSDNLWTLRALPERLLILGGGPIGSELAQAFARYGSKVTQVEMLPRIMSREDEDVSALLTEKFIAEGIDVRTGHRARSFIKKEGSKFLICERAGEETAIAFDEVIIAVGRQAHTCDLGLEGLAIQLNKNGTIEHNEFLQTNHPNIFVCGDVAGPFQFTHTAAHQAWYAAVNALFGCVKKFKVDYSVIPWATFTDPEIARVGLNETDAREKGIACEVTRYGLDDLDRAIADEAACGLVKVLTVPGKDNILGATIVGEHAGDLLTEFISAMKHGYGLNKILSTIHIYPTLAEANKYAAGAWKSAHAPAWALAMAQKFHTWMRG